jgi:hypothetical protein
MLRSLANKIETDAWDDRLLGELQHTLAALADVEVDHEIEREHIAASSGSAADKERLFAACERRYRLSRELYRQRLDALQHYVRLRVTAGL